MNRNEARRAGRGFTLIEVLVVMAVIAILAALLFTPRPPREKWRQASCQCNLKQIGLGMLMFAQDHQGRLPEAHAWPEALLPYLKGKRFYRCPVDRSKAGVSYAMSPAFSGASVEDYPNAAELIIAFDADKTGRPVARHDGGVDCLFMDGHAKWFKGIPDQLQQAPVW